MRKLTVIMLAVVIPVSIHAYGYPFKKDVPVQISGGQYFQKGNLVSTDSMEATLRFIPECADSIESARGFRTAGLVSFGLGMGCLVGAGIELIVAVTSEYKVARDANAIVAIILGSCSTLLNATSFFLFNAGASALNEGVNTYNMKLSGDLGLDLTGDGDNNYGMMLKYRF
jgi:hypothetical protein